MRAQYLFVTKSKKFNQLKFNTNLKIICIPFIAKSYGFKPVNFNFQFHNIRFNLFPLKKYIIKN